MNALCAFLVCLTVSVSAYTNADGAGHGITASGVRTREGMAACGPSFPFGTVFVVQGKPYACMDRGGLVTDGHLDLWVSDEDTAWEFGRANMTVGVWR